ncbi:MAG: glycerate kinase [Christensenellaceae bacterium]|jgi:glycerate kinase
MKKVLLVPDSFKGTMSSLEICHIMERAIKKHAPACEVVSIPVADGGEGTVDSFLAAVGGEKVTLPVKGPSMEDVEGFYGILPDGTAVIEMAAAAGLPLAGEANRVEKATTYGVGQLIVAAAARGCREIVIGLGGSATNDLGCGAAAAAGVRFMDSGGNEFVPVGETLGRIAKIDVSAAEKKLAGIRIVAMCDVDNPLCGANGAAYVFAPQKGADRAMVELLDQNLQKVAAVVRSELGMDISNMAGAGAAGGMGAGMTAFFGAQLRAGIEAVLDTVKFDTLIENADMVFSGEGRIDTQSLRGKVVIGVARRAQKHHVPVVAIVGDIGGDIDAAYDMGVAGIFSINRVAVPFSQASLRAKDDLFLTMDNLMRFIKARGEADGGQAYL